MPANRTARRTLAACLLALTLGVAGACSSSSSGSGPSSGALATDVNGPSVGGTTIPSGAAVVTFTPQSTVDAATLDQVAQVLRDRAAALSLKGVVVDVKGDKVEASVPKGISTATVRSLGDQKALGFRPVQQAFPGGANDNTGAPRCSSPQATATAPCLAADDKDPGSTLLLGPSVVDGSVLDQVVAARSGSTWSVTIKVADAQRAKLSTVLACPSGQTCSSDVGGRFAMVLDGQVISSPKVTAQTVADTDLTISGLDQTKAEKLADDLRVASKPLPVALQAASSAPRWAGHPWRT